MNLKIVKNPIFPKLKHYKSGKVREVYDLGENILILSTDRISAFDVILNNPIPYKGPVINKLSEFWFTKTSHIIKNHFITADFLSIYRDLLEYYEDLKCRAMIVKKGNVIPFECIVRGYLMGSAYESYLKTKSISDISLGDGFVKGSKLPFVLFTPSTKEDSGHDRNVNYAEFENTLGKEKAKFLKDKSIELFEFVSNCALKKGLILIDTKFEFVEINGELILADEIFTPDSSRFILKEDYDKGCIDLSLDKQYVRNYLLSINWDKTPPSPDLPESVIQETSKRYLEIYKLITDKDLAEGCL
jgi:phosphoribosylaminoimidazole-succinocarboxamide synthase